jgi:hypothetical protein
MTEKVPIWDKVKGEVSEYVDAEMVDCMGIVLGFHTDDTGKWQATEPQTGTRFTVKCSTKQEAIKAAIATVKTRGLTNVQENIEKFLRSTNR